jgi:hypothetical protein
MFFVKTILKAGVIGCRTTSRIAADQYSTCSAAAVGWPGCGRNAGDGRKLPIRLGRSGESAGAAGSPDLVSRQQYASENFSAQRDRVGASGSIEEWKALNIHCMATSIGS